ncbi:YjjG family noncanonical pyrimidine nucleotidase [Haloflavibacter putidus]|uniref:YjjG family noncanonical pyrimidine nucleotidase n=1 Tax=Haloflavibacter putidus TaxID=2576776 RepID=UPI001F19309D|nr:YjjG family noncanonical pyrimidine nucleotidase [Haloflavibacter putidus]
MPLIKPNNITDIFFDLDHTLWDFERNSALAFQTIFKKNSIAINLDTFLDAYVPINLSYWKMYREGKINKEDLRYQRLNEAFLHIKQEHPAETVNKLAADYINHLPDNNHLFEHVTPTLDYLQQKYNLHIITNGFDEVQFKKLRKSKIEHYFKSVTTSETAGVKKPDPLIFETALKQAKASANTSLMIGDNLEADILGAEKLGWQTIFFDLHGEEHNGIKIDSIKKLTELL